MRDRPGRPSADAAASFVVVVAYSVGLGAATVLIPLVALDAGYDAAAVGFLVATAAACQFTMRLALPWLLGRFADRTLVAAACVATVAAFGLLVVSVALPVFIAAQLLQGAGRAIFWTANQTHVIRTGGRPVERLVALTMAGNAGTLSGPVLGGVLATIGLGLGLGAAALATAIGALAAILLRRLPAYDRAASTGTLGLLRRDGIDVACWASIVGGTWWSMVGSYVPVMAIAAGIGAAGLGLLVTLSEGAGLAALVALRRVPTERVRPIVVGAAVATMTALLGLAAVAAIGPVAVVAFLPLMLVGGAATGTVTALGPALASLAASPAEQGDALSLSGMSRAGALLAAPATVGALLSIVTVPAAVAIVAIGAAIPGAVLPGARRRRPAS